MSDPSAATSPQRADNLHLHPANPVSGNDVADFERDGVVCLRGMFGAAWCTLLHDAAMEAMASGRGRVREPALGRHHSPTPWWPDARPYHPFQKGDKL